MSKIIYVVDDEPSVLQVLGILLRRLDPSWQVTEFSTGPKAIEAVRKVPPNLVLADQEMPGMTGSQMHEVIRQIAPASVRIIVSAQMVRADQMGAAHQFLGKPFAVPDLQKRIRQAIAAQEILQNPELAKLAMSIRSFPVLPSVYGDLMLELENERSTLQKIAELVRQDGGVLTRVLQVANSPLFGGAGAITDATNALLQLGTRIAKALVLSIHVFKGYQRLHFPEMPVELLWNHSCNTAALAWELCRRTLGEGPANDAFLAGLVHDLGCLMLMENDGEAFRAVCQKTQQEGVPLWLAEKRVFHVAHEELSAFMLRLWGMSEAVIEAVTYHNAPWESPHRDKFSPTVALYMANILTRRQSPPDKLLTPELDQKFLEAVGAPAV